MYQAVKVSGGLFDLLAHVVITLQVENVSYKIECILVVLHLGIEVCEVESICKVVFVDLAKILVAP